MFLAKRSPWILVVAALFSIHAVQAVVQGVAPGYSSTLSALGRALVAAYLIAIWYFLGANRQVAWRLDLGLRLIVLMMLGMTGIVFILDADVWWLRVWYAVVLFTTAGLGWYYGLRPFLRDRARFIAVDAES